MKKCENDLCNVRCSLRTSDITKVIFHNFSYYPLKTKQYSKMVTRDVMHQKQEEQRRKKYIKVPNNHIDKGYKKVKLAVWHP